MKNASQTQQSKHRLYFSTNESDRLSLCGDSSPPILLHRLLSPLDDSDIRRLNSITDLQKIVLGVLHVKTIGHFSNSQNRSGGARAGQGKRTQPPSLKKCLQ